MDLLTDYLKLTTGVTLVSEITGNGAMVTYLKFVIPTEDGPAIVMMGFCAPKMEAE